MVSGRTAGTMALLALMAAPLAGQSGGVSVGGGGITFSSADQATRLTLRFRIQQLYTARTAGDDDLALAESSFQIRRARLRLGGTVFDPRLGVNFQLSFSRSDLDMAPDGTPNVIRDAAITWRVGSNLQLVMGQTKLPGNRQRTVSSGDLELPERSIVNNRFTFDRDIGIQFRWADTLGGQPVHVRGAISNGEGRGRGNDAKMALTGRVEWLPLGPFTDGGDDFEGDLVGEESPKLAIGISAQHNRGATRTGGMLGSDLHQPRDISTVEGDLLVKYRGLSFYGEMARRSADDPVTTAPGAANRYVYAGTGTLAQLSWQAGRGWSPVVRWVVVTPDDSIDDQAGAGRQEQLGMGLTRYINRHRVKSTIEVLHDRVEADGSGPRRSAWIGRWSLEVGI